MDISEVHYNELKSMAGGKRTIEKKRYLIPWKKKTIELDIFYGKLSGLIIAEIEFKSIEEAEKSIVPHWFGEEVTHNSAYTNNSLSASAPPEKFTVTD